MTVGQSDHVVHVVQASVVVGPTDDSTVEARVIGNEEGCNNVVEESNNLECADENDQPESFVSLVEYDVRDFYWNMGLMQKIARSPHYSLVYVLVDAVASFYFLAVGLGTLLKDDFDSKEFVIVVLAHFFTCFFSCAMVVQFLAFKLKAVALRDAEFALHAVLTICLILSVWGIPVVAGMQAGETSPDIFKDFDIVQCVRLFFVFSCARKLVRRRCLKK